MATDCIAQLRFNGDGFAKPVIAAFDLAHASSDGGAILLKALDARLGLTERLAACLTDRRQPGKVQHAMYDLLRQRVFGLALGYADCNDAARVADDPIHKLLLDRDPLHGAALGSQPTLSRFEPPGHSRPAPFTHQCLHPQRSPPLPPVEPMAAQADRGAMATPKARHEPSSLTYGSHGRLSVPCRSVRE